MLVILLVVSCMLPACVWAQKNELGFTAGGIKSSSQSGVVCEAILICQPPASFFNIDTGGAFEAVFARRLAGFGPASLHLELPVIAGPSRGTSPLGGVSPGNLSSLFFTPSLKLKLLPAASVSPFVSAGGGLAHFSVNSTGSNNGAFQVGGGADFKTPVPRLGIRAELRDVISGQPNFGPGTSSADSRRHNVFVGGGVVLKF